MNQSTVEKGLGEEGKKKHRERYAERERQKERERE